MAFWDNVGRKVTETTTKTVEKAKEMTDVAKLNASINDEERRIDNLYYQLGKRYASLYSEEYDEAFEDIIDAIQDSKDKIEDYKEQIMEIKKVCRCVSCGAEVQVGSAFCSSCGTPIPKAPEVHREQSLRCAKCGSVVNDGDRFCTTCGTPVPVETVSESIDKQEEPPCKVCSKCGTKLGTDSAFCTECGTPVL